MAYHHDLLLQSATLLSYTPQTQASLRRAVSTAYYSVFHLLIFEAVSNWENQNLRAILGRAFDHSVMKEASSRIVNMLKESDFPQDAQIITNLHYVGQTFTQLQESRHSADYDLSIDLDPVDALAKVKSAEKVFALWPQIQTHTITQNYLVALLSKRIQYPPKKP